MQSNPVPLTMQPSIVVACPDMSRALPVLQFAEQLSGNVTAAMSMEQVLRRIRNKDRVDVVVVLPTDDQPEFSLLVSALRATELNPRLVLVGPFQRSSAIEEARRHADVVVLSAQALTPGLLLGDTSGPVDESKAYRSPLKLAMITGQQDQQDWKWSGVEVTNIHAQDLDGIVVNGSNALAQLAALAEPGLFKVAPIIELSARPSGVADVRLSPTSPASVLDSIRPLVDRWRLVRRHCLDQQDERFLLLAHMFVRNTDLTPVLDPGRPSVARYHQENLFSTVRSLADSAARSGWLDREFSERVNVCPTCRSARMLVREECPRCRSSNVEEQSIIHHFRCAYQGLDTDFRSGRDLVCPKCRHELTHFGVEYDRPGSVMHCHDCGESTGEAAVGFRCLDCNDTHDAAKVGSTRIDKYVLNDAGRRLLLNAVTVNDVQSGHGRSNLGDELYRTLMTCQDKDVPHCLVMLRLDETQSGDAGLGDRVVKETLGLVTQNLREYFSEDDVVWPIGKGAMVLVRGRVKGELENETAQILEAITETLKTDCPMRLDVLDGTRALDMMRHL